MSNIAVGDPIPALLQLFDYANDKFPVAVLRNASGTELSGSPLDLALVADGLYANNTVNMPNTPFVSVQYFVYTDSGHTTLDESYTADLAIYTRETGGGGGGGAVVASNIIGVVGSDGCRQPGTGIQDTLVKGSGRVLAVRLVVQHPNGEPFDIALATNVTARFLNDDRTVLELTSDDGDIDITVPAAGKMEISITDVQSALLMAGSPQAFTMIVDMPTGPIAINLPYQLAIVDDSVGAPEV